MSAEFDERLNAIAWREFGTAYGPATAVPDQLRRLAGPDKKAALAASHELWSGLCHQHVQLASAALPALPFLLEVLGAADDELTSEILDILLGFAKGTNRQRIMAYQKAFPRLKGLPEQQWVADLRAALISELPRLRQLTVSRDAETVRYALDILSELAADQASEGVGGEGLVTRPFAF